MPTIDELKMQILEENPHIVDQYLSDRIAKQETTVGEETARLNELKVLKDQLDAAKPNDQTFEPGNPDGSIDPTTEPTE